MFAFFVAFAAFSTTETEARLGRMIALYDEVCLKAFPDDKAVEEIMKAKNSRALSADEVKVTFRNDPGLAWEVPNESASVWLELPPFHACSVRWNASEIPDFHEYRAVAGKYERGKGGFVPVGPWDDDQGDNSRCGRAADHARQN